MQEVNALCTKIIVINEGKLVAIDSKEKLMEKLEAGQRIKVIVEGEFEDIQEKIKEVKGVKIVELLKTENNINEILISADKITDIRKELSKKIINSGFSLLEQNKVIMSLEEVFTKLTK